MFDAQDQNGVPIYHTNVLMCVATDFAMVGLSLIKNSDERRSVKDRLEQSGRRVIELSPEQIHSFAGNAIELRAKEGNILVMSQAAKNALRADQIELIEKSARILPLNVPTIELSGGSVRCMIAGVHYQREEIKKPDISFRSAADITAESGFGS